MSLFLFSCHTEKQVALVQWNGAGLGRPAAAEWIRTRDWEVARGEGGGGCLASGWGANVCVGAGRTGGAQDRPDWGRGDEDGTRGGLCSIGAGDITE